MEAHTMMRDLMNGGMAWMMTGMGVIWVLVILVLILGAAALIKYLIRK
jgi:hypothetical protein